MFRSCESFQVLRGERSRDRTDGYREFVRVGNALSTANDAYRCREPVVDFGRKVRRSLLRFELGRIAFAAMFLVGGDDALDERMADDVTFGELNDGDAFHVLESPVRFEQA